PVKRPVRAHRVDVRPVELKFPRQNRPAADPPGEHGPAPDGIVLGDLDLPTVEFVGCLRADEVGRVQKRYRGNTALGGIEDAVDPIAHDADAHRAELPAVAEELAARLVA